MKKKTKLYRMTWRVIHREHLSGSHYIVAPEGESNYSVQQRETRETQEMFKITFPMPYFPSVEVNVQEVTVPGFKITLTPLEQKVFSGALPYDTPTGMFAPSESRDRRTI